MPIIYTRMNGCASVGVMFTAAVLSQMLEETQKKGIIWKRTSAHETSAHEESARR